MKKDINNKDDIKILIDTFYIKVREDSLISHFFSDVVNVNWEKLLLLISNFLGNVIFHNSDYFGNPIRHYQIIIEKNSLNNVHFDRWVVLFKETGDEFYQGKNVEIIKHKA